MCRCGCCPSRGPRDRASRIRGGRSSPRPGLAPARPGSPPSAARPHPAGQHPRRRRGPSAARRPHPRACPRPVRRPGSRSCSCPSVPAGQRPRSEPRPACHIADLHDLSDTLGPSAGTRAIDGWPAGPPDARRLLRGRVPRQGSAVRAVVGNTRNQDHCRRLHAIRRTPRTALRRTVRSSPAWRRTAGMIRTPAGRRRGAYEASPCLRFSISASTTAETDRHRSPRSCGNRRPRQADAPAAGAPAMHLSAARTGPAPASLVDERQKDSTLQLRSHGPVDPSAYGPGRERCRPTEPSRRRWLLATNVNPRTRQSRSVRAPRPQKRSSCRAPGGACATTWRAPGLAVYAP